MFRITCAAVVALTVAACSKSKKTTAGGGSPDTTTPGNEGNPASGQVAEVSSRSFNGDPKVAAQGRVLFLAYNCYGCHGGLAGGAMGPSLRDTTWKYGGTDQAIYSSIHDGRPMGMPTWGKTLSEQQIRTLITYIRSLRSSAEPKFFFATQMAEAGVDTADFRKALR
ncbi:MAG TPA: c-type cytochrome [Gemmatimonadaceae bacterium]|nr:c-type cytochrome [Gemmatimonadaceae bacterium]